MRRKALIAGSALTLAGALSVTVALADGGRDTPARPARPAAPAQRVDLTFPAPQAPPGHQLLHLKLRNGNSFHATVCVDNSTAGQNCTEDFGRLSPSTNAELKDVDIDPTADAAQVTVHVSDQEHTTPVPVTMDTVTTRCFTVVSAQEFTETPGCVGF